MSVQDFAPFIEFLKKQVEQGGVPILELDLEYGHPAGAQVKIRAEAFMEMLESRA